MTKLGWVRNDQIENKSGYEMTKMVRMTWVRNDRLPFTYTNSTVLSVTPKPSALSSVAHSVSRCMLLSKKDKN